MQKICFDPRFKDNIFVDKFVTIRKGRRDYRLGVCDFDCGEWLGTLNIFSVTYIKIKHITKDILLQEKCETKEDLINLLHNFYTDINDETEVTIINYSK